MLMSLEELGNKIFVRLTVKGHGLIVPCTILLKAIIWLS